MGELSEMTTPDFAKLTESDMVKLGAVLVGLGIAALVGWAAFLLVVKMMVGG